MFGRKVAKYAEVDLAPVSDPLLISIRKQYDEYYEEWFPGEKQGVYREADWRRVQHAAQLIGPGEKSVLEVGVGPGQLLNYLTLSGRHEEVVGIDVRRGSRYLQVAPKVAFRKMSVEKLAFPDRHFDAVFCMEVLEHVPREVMVQGLKELRRVVRGKLIMSVPFDEPLPLPRYHLQRFDAASIGELFPAADVHLLHRPKRKGWPWALLIETPR